MILELVVILVALYLAWRIVAYAIVFASIRLIELEKLMAKQAKQVRTADDGSQARTYLVGYGERTQGLVLAVHKLAKRIVWSGRHSLDAQWRDAIKVEAKVSQ